MKILFCIDTMTKGGAERVIANLSNMFIKNGDRVSIVTLLKRDSAYELDKKIIFDTLSIKEGKKNVFSKIYHTIKNIKDMRKYIHNNNFDVVISFLPRASFYTALAMFGLKCKLIISERNDPNSIYKTNFEKFIYKKIYSFADGFVFQTKDAQKFFSKRIQDKSIVIPNPVNDAFYIEKKVLKRKKHIINVGRLTEQKNQELLIYSFSEFSEIYDDYKLYIYGEGPLRKKLEQQIKKLNLNDKVFLPGNVDNIQDKIFDASMFVFSSDYEGMPNALMEALTLGVPCVSTDCPCGGPRELITNNVDGMLVPTNDKKAMVDAMKKIIENDLFETFSSKSKAKMKNYKIEKINFKWEKYVKKIVNGG